MRVLGLAGSPRRGGNSDLLLAEVMRGAAGRGAEVKTIYLSELSIAPCTHCDACLTSGNCKVQDDMQGLYREMEAADRIVLASPLHFMSFTAQMKLMIDRCQSLWVRKYRLKIPPLGDRRVRKGLLLSVGGNRTLPNLFEAAIITAKALFRTLDVIYSGEVVFSGIDARGDILKHPEFLKQAYEAGEKLVSDP